MGEGENESREMSAVTVCVLNTTALEEALLVLNLVLIQKVLVCKVNAQIQNGNIEATLRRNKSRPLVCNPILKSRQPVIKICSSNCLGYIRALASFILLVALS